MAAQSKLLPSGRSVKQLLSELTSLYLHHRTKISRTVYLTLFLALIHRIHNAISEQKTATRRQAEIRSRPSTGDVDDGRKKRVETSDGRCEPRVECTLRRMAHVKVARIWRCSQAEVRMQQVSHTLAS